MKHICRYEGFDYDFVLYMPKIAFLEVDREDASLIRERFPDAQIFEGSLQGEELTKRFSNVEVLSIFIYTHMTQKVVEGLPILKLLCTRSVGTNHIDLAVCGERGVTVCNVPDYGSHVIAEHVFALLLSTLRHVHRADQKVESGVFDYHGLRGVSLKGKTIGIVGTGKIGRRVARIAHGFSMRILAHDVCHTTELEEFYGVRYVTCDELLKGSDIITLHIPAFPATHHLINAAALSTMKNGAILVNTARGELIDSHALLDALKSGKVAYALLDVLEHEKNFEENKELIKHPHVVSTPHIAFYADDSMRNMYLNCFQSIEEFLAGRIPEHVVDAPKVVCDLQGIKS